LSKVYNTKILNNIKELLKKSDKSLPAQEILVELQSFDSSINKTTVYRNLEKLSKLGLIRICDIKNRTKYWELTDCHFHTHYLVCQNCNSQEEISKKIVKKFEDLIQQISLESKDWKVKNHLFQVKGLCKKCKV
jgi:Fe2+ or Zn2+ uptake regulation protein